MGSGSGRFIADRLSIAETGGVQDDPRPQAYRLRAVRNRRDDGALSHRRVRLATITELAWTPWIVATVAAWGPGIADGRVGQVLPSLIAWLVSILLCVTPLLALRWSMREDIPPSSRDWNTTEVLLFGFSA